MPPQERGITNKGDHYEISLSKDYTTTMLEKAGMTTYETATTPGTAANKASNDDNENTPVDKEERALYRIIGKLQRMTHTRPDPSFATQELATANIHPIEKCEAHTEDFWLPSTVIFGEALSNSDETRLGELVDLSQKEGDIGLQNLVPETRWLPTEARRLGALGSSAFGAGFGGSVYALVKNSEAKQFLEQWHEAYVKEFPERASSCEFFITAPGPGATELEETPPKASTKKRPAAVLAKRPAVSQDLFWACQMKLPSPAKDISFEALTNPLSPHLTRRNLGYFEVMRQLRWWGLCGLTVTSVVSTPGNNEDLASAFNKAFFDQLKGTPGHQAPQVIEMSSMVPPASSGRPSREAELDQQLQKMVGGPGYTIEFINEDAPVRAENLRQLFPGPLQFDLDGSGTLRGWSVVGWMWAPDPKRGPPYGKFLYKPYKKELFPCFHTDAMATKTSTLQTSWATELTEPPWAEHPRPQLRRASWKTLNGWWRCRTVEVAADATKNDDFEEMLKVRETDHQILVPFCLESQLGGVGRALDPAEVLWYHRQFDVQKSENCRYLLHFEAVDYSTTVWVNGVLVGSHKGGFTPFEFDITEAMGFVDSDASSPSRSIELVVQVLDATGNFQARGKQSKKPHGIWYTRVSGIWQSVWLESVPKDGYISDLRLETSLDHVELQLILGGHGGDQENLTVRATVLEKEMVVTQVLGTAKETLKLHVPNAKVWCPETPFLYDLHLELMDSDLVIDEVESYFGLRTVGKHQGAEGHWRITLNGESCFHLGPLDQGWWPDGLLTAPTDQAIRFDIEFLKQSGFNMIRKHVKMEPRRYYYHCDVLGMMIWQDQPSGTEKEGDCFKVPPWTRLEETAGRDAEWPLWAKQQFRKELREMVDCLHNHPSVMVWIPFNEAWGQHDTLEIGEWLRSYDPSRLVNIASGGNFFEVGDIVDHHNYPEADFPLGDVRFENFIKVIGEFGGHGLVLPEEHLWQTSRKNWGYDVLKDASELEAKYSKSLEILADWMSCGIAAAVYTQTSDVECEVNGLLSYDRKIQKLNATFLAKVTSIMESNGNKNHLCSQAQPIREPDPLVMDMLSSMSNMVQEVVAPTLHKTLHASAAPDSCQKDAVAHCSTARSQVHCLGQHRDDISDNCRRDLGKSVPFVCSAAIDKHCDVLHVGILDCLQKYQEELSGDCKDAFLATSKVIKSLNSAAQAPTLRPQSNMPVVLSSPSTPSPNQALKNLGALAEHNLDSQLAKFGGLKPTQAPLASAIQQAEKQAEDELIHDADHIEALLTQMSDKISAKPAVTTAAPQQGPSFSVMFVLMVLLLVAYLYFQSEAGRQVWLKLRRVWLNTGKPLLKKGLDGHLGDEEVPL
eukprot:symbB.v1.2.003188.t1/scaffold158.1/size292703/1